MNFTTDARIPSPAVTRELVVLKRQLGGEFGKLAVDGKSIEVLKLDASNYVTGKADRNDKLLLAAAGVDLHEVKSTFDAQALRIRYRRYYGR